jgi:hypothetical protein
MKSGWVRRAVDAGLPEAYRGHQVRFFAWQTRTVRHHVEVVTVADWLREQLGALPDELQPAHWLGLPQQRLLQVTAGCGTPNERSAIVAGSNRASSCPSAQRMGRVSAYDNLESSDIRNGQGQKRLRLYGGPLARPTWQSAQRGSYLGAGRRRRSRSGRAWSMVGRGLGLGCRGRRRGRVRDQADFRIGCRACCSCRFWRRRQARINSILTSVRSIKPQKSNVSFPSVFGGPMSGSVTRRGWYSPTLKAMSSASLVDGFGPIPRSRRHRPLSVPSARWPGRCARLAADPDVRLRRRIA